VILEILIGFPVNSSGELDCFVTAVSERSLPDSDAEFASCSSVTVLAVEWSTPLVIDPQEPIVGF
jgi:hypothetical protein